MNYRKKTEFVDAMQIMDHIRITTSKDEILILSPGEWLVLNSFCVLSRESQEQFAQLYEPVLEEKDISLPIRKPRKRRERKALGNFALVERAEQAIDLALSKVS